MNDAGYRVAYAQAADNLRIGNTVIADSVNPIALTRDAWLAVAASVPVLAIEIEITCSDANEHRRRVETRTADIPGMRLPTWDEVLSREYDPWDRDHTTIDTSARTVLDWVSAIRELISQPQD